MEDSKNDLSETLDIDPDELKSEPVKELTFGQKLVGLNFNPSDDDAVGTVKQIFADAADILHNVVYSGGGGVTELQSRLYNHAIGEILNAQMNVVKVLTLKY
jgi:hypothetical protein